ncbi:MAG: methylenetetrahydromethanopterin reductase [Subtercola sp.]|nr:methylenetetrahydromethanopterin reductase [Subtercola sp.]
MDATKTNLTGQFGVWRRSSDIDGPLARSVEQLGFGSLWLGGAPADFEALVLEVLDATETLTVATGIANIFKTEPAAAAESYRRIDAAHPGRFLLGLGPGHRESVGPGAAKPYTALTEYLDRLDALGFDRDRIVLAALGPRVLELARERTAGAHPYLVTPEHTADAWQLLGPTSLLVPEQHVILEENPVTARAAARAALAMYLGLVNYRRSWLRLGFTEADLEGGGSDRFVDEVVAHGSPADVAAALRAHVDAGADQVLAQVIGEGSPLPALTAISETLGLARR